MESNFLLYGIIDDIWYDSHNKKKKSSCNHKKLPRKMKL